MIGNVVLAILLALTLYSWVYAGRTTESKTRLKSRRRTMRIVFFTVAVILLYRLW